ncbi:Lrp/AsnC family transcriptional regulator [Luteimonas sp. RD2P54]|uniref:Lrp/AsnC family transcriptional regulator n=1 Tax=Luteimonas endophytica TaxID=3042023 RepID=A0ABT6J7Q2_9GAMM|nr:Lrp/AsnC family transcriptional regulator [Luteimonas endophytica]MDH5822846.1 Lrp/AsnC family transcriptional regulator [Luteimonas endophytica]
MPAANARFCPPPAMPHRAAAPAGARKAATHLVDAFDRRILELYRQNTRLAADAIGEAVGLSATAVQRRLKRMREHGVIRAEVALVSPAALGLDTTCIVGVDLEREGPEALDRFRARMARCRQVTQCYYVTGASDFVLIVQVENMNAFVDFTREWLTPDENVLAFTTQVVMDRAPAG